jgi:hypothetical protein
MPNSEATKKEIAAAWGRATEGPPNMTPEERKQFEEQRARIEAGGHGVFGQQDNKVPGAFRPSFGNNGT